MQRARTQAHRGVTFVEGVSIFGPIASALDYLLQQGREAVFLSCDDIILTGKGLVGGGAEPLTLTPLNERHDLEVYFGMICLAAAPETDADLDPFTSGSMDLSVDPEQLHPVAAFARLIYRVLNGSEIPSSIKYSKNVYAPATTLENLSNNLIRDLLCHERTWTWPGAVLQELCRYEEVRWRPSKPGHVGSSASAASSDGSRRGSARGSTATASASGTVGESGAPPSRAAGPLDSSHGETIVRAPKPMEASAPLPKPIPQGIVSPGRPGFIVSPHGSGRLQAVPGADWAPARQVTCLETGQPFTLPESIPAMMGAVLPGRPGVVISPYGGGETVD
jgi:hypothetical protein